MDRFEGELDVRRKLLSFVGRWKWNLKDGRRMKIRGIKFDYPEDSNRMDVTIEFEQVKDKAKSKAPPSP